MYFEFKLLFVIELLVVLRFLQLYYFMVVFIEEFILSYFTDFIIFFVIIVIKIELVFALFLAQVNLL
jgi:hypothetical protein